MLTSSHFFFDNLSFKLNLRSHLTHFTLKSFSKYLLWRQIQFQLGHDFNAMLILKKGPKSCSWKVNWVSIIIWTNKWTAITKRWKIWWYHQWTRRKNVYFAHSDWRASLWWPDVSRDPSGLCGWEEGWEEGWVTHTWASRGTQRGRWAMKTKPSE